MKTNSACLNPLENLIHWSVTGLVWLFSFYYVYSEMNHRGEMLSRQGRSSHEFDFEIDLLVLYQLPQFLSLMVLQLMATELLRRISSKSQQLQLLPTLHFLVGSFLMLLMFNWKMYAVVLSASLFGYVMLVMFQSLIISYLMPTAVFFGLELFERLVISGTNLGYEEMVLLVVINSWLLCRMLMYMVDDVKNVHSRKHRSLVIYLGYLFYGPVLKGPLIGPHDYLAPLSLQVGAADPLAKRLIRLLRNLMRLLVALVFLQVCRHFAPLTLLSTEQPLGVASLGKLEILGAAFWAGFYFWMKYVVIYGLGNQLAIFEGVGVPLEPRCPLWMSRASELWKYFDNGMYLFIRDYLYRPLSGSKSGSWLRHVLSSMTVFAYVYFWHGQSRLIFYWTAINFVLVTLESTVGRLLRSDRLRGWKQALEPVGCRRCEAMINSAPLAIAHLTQLGFLTSSLSLHQRAVAVMLEVSPDDVVIGLFFFYCIYHTTLDIKHWCKLDHVSVETRSVKQN